MTLIRVQEEDRILLAMKKRGFGAGKYNGFGGKVELRETLLEAALREFEEVWGFRSGSSLWGQGELNPRLAKTFSRPRCASFEEVLDSNLEVCFGV
jgi:8-oxo-dGTP pyrophosphatase MutT (NUDIX family)